jgi:hypothetical protein
MREKFRAIKLIESAQDKISNIAELEDVPHIKTDLERAYDELLDALQILYNGDMK